MFRSNGVCMSVCSQLPCKHLAFYSYFSTPCVLQVAVLADSDLCDEDTDAQECVAGDGLETEGEAGGYTEGEGFTEGEGGFAEGEVEDGEVHGHEDTAVHHIVEHVTTLPVVTKQEPHSGAEM